MRNHICACGKSLRPYPRRGLGCGDRCAADVIQCRFRYRLCAEAVHGAVSSHRARLVVSPLCTVACTTVLFPFFSGVATLRIVTIRELLPTNLRQLVNNCLGIGDIVRHYLKFVNSDCDNLKRCNFIGENVKIVM